MLETRTSSEPNGAAAAANEERLGIDARVEILRRESPPRSEYKPNRVDDS